MRIGFDAKRIVRNATGLGSYARTLVNDMQNIVDGQTELYLYAPDRGSDVLRRQVKASPKVRFVYPDHRVIKSLWRSHGIVRDLRRDQIDIYHGLSGELPIGIRQSGIRSVVTIHDLIFMRHPEYYQWIDTRLYTWKFRRTIEEADRIIAISECTKRDIIELGGVDPSKIDIVYQSCSTRFRERVSPEALKAVRDRYHLPERYIINVGTIEPRKNIILAVKAMELLPKDISLVIVGRPTSYADEVKRYASRHGLADRLLMLSGVPNADLPAIVQMGEVFVYPSRYEGFGIPIIEAIQAGLPVVAATGSCLEEAGGPDNLYVGPDDVVGMAEAVIQSLRGTADRDERIRRSQQYVSRFEGNSVASQVVDVYKRLMTTSHAAGT